MSLLRSPVQALKRQFQSPAPVVARPGTKADRDEETGFGKWLVISFLVCVLLPALVSFVYFSAVATPSYFVESKLVIKSAMTGEGASGANSIFSKIGLGQINSGNQEAMIVSDYVKSRAIIADIGGKSKLESVFSNPDIDFFSRLDANAGLETLWKYWKDHVYVQVDTLSNIITIRVFAFSANDAVDLTNMIIGKVETLINDLSLRSRQDLLLRAQKEVERSATELAGARAEILAFQQKTRTLDPIESAKQIAAIVSSLTLQKLEIESSLSTSKSIGLTAAPGEAQSRARLAAIDAQIKQLESSLAGSDGAATITNQLKDFEALKMQEDYYKKMYEISRASAEQARLGLARQQLYIAVVVPPIAPDEAAYPKALTNSLLFFIGIAIIWGIICLLIASLRDGLR